MSIDFKIQKDTKKTIEIKPDDFNDINLDDLDDFNIQNELDKSNDSSLVFTKAPVKPTPVFKDKKESPPTAKVNVNKDSVKVNVPISKPPKRPLVEPGSMDLGLDMITNQKKKNIPKEESE